MPNYNTEKLPVNIFRHFYFEKNWANGGVKLAACDRDWLTPTLALCLVPLVQAARLDTIALFA